MPNISSILAVIEPDIHPFEVAERAAWLARSYDANIRLLLCDADSGPLQPGWYLSNEAKEIGAQISAAQNAFIDDIADNIRATGIVVETDILEERPMADGIIRMVVEQNAGILVKGTQHHSNADRAVFVDTDWQLVRQCPCPLYLVKPNEVRDKPVIIAAVDPTHDHDKPAVLDQLIVDAALTLAKKTQGDVHLLHTYQRLTGVGRAASRSFKPLKIPMEKIDQRIQSEHRSKLDALAAANDIPAENVHQLPGRTRDLLPTFARAEGADLVVMGALARWSLKRAIIGSTAERVLDFLPCDVLIVRPEPH